MLRFLLLSLYVTATFGATSNPCNQEACTTSADCDPQHGQQTCCNGVCRYNNDFEGKALLGAECIAINDASDEDRCALRAGCGGGANCNGDAPGPPVVYGTCTRQLDDGCSCQANAQCRNTCQNDNICGNGGGGGCAATPGALGCRCTTVACADGLTCFDVGLHWGGVADNNLRCGTPLALGEACNSNLDQEEFCPADNVCQHGGGATGTCALKGQVAAGQPCNYQNECVADHFCDTSGSNNCEPYNTAGQGCSRSGRDRECVPPLICAEDSTCKAAGASDQSTVPCDRDVECPAGDMCDQGGGGRPPPYYCYTPASVALGGTCRITEQCQEPNPLKPVRCQQSDALGNRTCVEEGSVALGKYCQFNSACAEGYFCNNNLCDLGDAGKVCFNNGDCNGNNVDCLCDAALKTKTCGVPPLGSDPRNDYCQGLDAIRNEPGSTREDDIRWECCHGCDGRSVGNVFGEEFDCSAITQTTVPECSLTGRTPTVYKNCPANSVLGKSDKVVQAAESGAAPVAGALAASLVAAAVAIATIA